MDTDRPQSADESPPRPSAWLPALAWTALLAALVVWQAWLTLALFGGPANLTSELPILSGAHPQHLYLGALGAEGLRTTGSSCVYDPAFQIAYPKTPIFDGSRLAETFLYFVGDAKPVVAYKLGVALMCLAVPVLLVVTCWACGVHWMTAAIASTLGVLIWWGPHGRAAIEAGDSEMFLASLCGFCHLGFLIRFDRDPGLRAWLGLVLTAALTWLAQPMLFPLSLPLLLIYYLTAGVRHPLVWHFALFTAMAAGVGLNMFWLQDWVSYWWLRSPFPSSNEMLPHRTFLAFWNAPLWGGSEHRFFALFLFASALVGVAIWNETRQRTTARLLGIGAVGLLALSLLGISWEPLGQMGTSIFLSPALWFASIPAAHAWVWILGKLTKSTAGRWSLAAVVLTIAAAGVLVRDELCVIGRCGIRVEPFTFGLNPQREDLVATIRQYTTPASRILWEDRKLPRKSSRWSVLLPWLTDRYYLGGLDPAAVIEHSSISFIDEGLEGRHIALWSDKMLDDYCRRYNVSWIIAWSPNVLNRLRNWPGVEKELPVHDDVTGGLFILKHPGPGYITRGHADVITMNSKHIVLGDVIPDNGEVILNLHYLAGLRASPSRVTVEREPCGHDPIGYVRLKMAGPVPRLTLTWDRTK